MKGYVECLLQVTGDAAGLNTFDKLFRSGKGPSWADRASDGAPRYSLHALFPVPEAIQRRGYETAGHLWCGDFWDVPDDLVDMQVKRLLGKRYYRFYTPGGVPENVFLKASYRRLRSRPPRKTPSLSYLIKDRRGEIDPETGRELIFDRSFRGDLALQYRVIT